MKYMNKRLVSLLFLFTACTHSFADEISTVSEVPKYTSVKYFYGDKVEITAEKDLIGKYDIVKAYTANNTKDPAFTSYDTTFSLPIKNGIGTHYNVKYVKPEIESHFFKDDEEIDNIVWEQDVFVPPSIPDNAEALAKKYMPVVVFNDQEEYFPQSLEQILEFSLPSVANSITISNDERGGNEVRMGEPLKEFLAHSGQNKSFFNFGTTEVQCAIDRKVDDLNLAYSHCSENPLVKPLFLRFNTGTLNNSTVYWDIAEENDNVYITYHFFYPFDPKNKPSNNPYITAHAFDRESFTIRLYKTPINTYKPIEIAYAGHLATQDLKLREGGTTYAEWSGGKTVVDWSHAQKIDNHPVIYKAQGAHAIYPIHGIYAVDLNLRKNTDTSIINLVINQLNEPAGSSANLKGAGGKYILPSNSNINLVKLDFNQHQFLNFSGYWVDVIGTNNAKFPPFIRTPVSTWFSSTREAKDRITLVNDFDLCLDENNKKDVYFGSYCSFIRERFANINGLNNYRAATVSVVDQATNEPIENATVMLHREQTQIREGTTDEDGKHTFFFPVESKVYSLSATANGQSYTCGDIHDYATNVATPMKNNAVVYECAVEEDPIEQTVNTLVGYWKSDCINGSDGVSGASSYIDYFKQIKTSEDTNTLTNLAFQYYSGANCTGSLIETVTETLNETHTLSNPLKESNGRWSFDSTNSDGSRITMPNNTTFKFVGGEDIYRRISASEFPSSSTSSEVRLVTVSGGNDRSALISPNGGEHWYNGSKQTISWMNQYITGSSVDLYVLHDDPSGLISNHTQTVGQVINSKNWYKFASNVANTGNYTFDPVDMHGTGNAYMVLVVSTSDKSKFDISEGRFSLNQ